MQIQLHLKLSHGIHLQITRKTPHIVFCILLAGDVATNPGPDPASNARFSNGRHINGLNASYLNARSLKAFATDPDQPNATSKVCKITLLQRLVYSAKYDIVCICETWLNDSVLNSEPLPGYCGFRHTPSRIL